MNKNLSKYARILHHLPNLRVGGMLYSFNNITGTINSHKICRYDFTYCSDGGLTGSVCTIDPYDKDPDAWYPKHYGTRWVFTYEEVMELAKIFEHNKIHNVGDK